MDHVLLIFFIKSVFNNKFWQQINTFYSEELRESIELGIDDSASDFEEDFEEAKEVENYEEAETSKFDHSAEPSLESQLTPTSNNLYYLVYYAFFKMTEYLKNLVKRKKSVSALSVQEKRAHQIKNNKKHENVKKTAPIDEHLSSIIDELKSEQSIYVLFKSIISVKMVTTLAYYTNKRIANLDLNETSVSVVEIYAYFGLLILFGLGNFDLLWSD